MLNSLAASAGAVGKRKAVAFALAFVLSSSALFGPAMAMPNDLAATPHASRLDAVRWVCGPYRWRPAPYYGGPYWRGYWRPYPYYWHYRWQ